MSLNAIDVTHWGMPEIRDIISLGYYLKLTGDTLWAMRSVS